MTTRTITTTSLLLAILAAPALAQFTIHYDGGGYTYRSSSGNWTYAHRYDTGATYNRVGNFATYRDNTGTTGYSFYGQYARFDSYSNSAQG